MKKISLYMVGLVFVSGSALADFTCKTEDDICKYTVHTGESSKVGLDGGGETCHKAETVFAGNGKFLVNPRAEVRGQHGQAASCNVSPSDATVKTVQVPGLPGGVTVTYYKKAVLTAHSETGSGPQAIGRTCHMICELVATHAAIQ